jgi:hypothetical protein
MIILKSGGMSHSKKVDYSLISNFSKWKKTNET